MPPGSLLSHGLGGVVLVLSSPWGAGCNILLHVPILQPGAAMNYFFRGGNIVFSYSGPGSKQFKTT